jgi:starch synthase
MMRVLYAASEIFPMAKTGGLGDVASALPAALAQAGVDVRLVMPAYPTALSAVVGARPAQQLADFGALGSASVIEAITPDSALPIWLIDSPSLYDRPGGPYQDALGQPWSDNLERFAMLSRAVALLAGDASPFAWYPDVMHAHDWHTGLAMPLLLGDAPRARTVFTIHNLAFAGVFGAERFALTGLPPEMLAAAGTGVDLGFSLLKAGLVFADWVTTVSPTYADEIQTPELGGEFAPLLAGRAESLSGILNGVDYGIWDPSRDPHIARRYSADDLAGKAACKTALREAFGLSGPPDAPLFGIVSRLTEQKGIDLVPLALERALDAGAQLVVLGHGDSVIEQLLRDWSSRHPARVGVRVEFDEALAHAVEAGADIFLMPSRFEPSGLNQMYSQRYGTPPVVHAVGGLADTVIDADVRALTDGTATGFMFREPTATAFASAIERALALFARPDAWRALQRTGMAQDFSWSRSAARYIDLYNSL